MCATEKNLNIKNQMIKMDYLFAELYNLKYCSYGTFTDILFH